MILIKWLMFGLKIVVIFMIKNIITIENLEKIYDLEIKKHVKNKRTLCDFDQNKMEYLLQIKTILLNGEYKGPSYHIFAIKEPKVRLVMSQNLVNKIINHFVARYILEPKLSKYLLDCNCATRKGKGTKKALELVKNHINRALHCHCEVFALKIDIKGYFYNIDHNVLKNLIRKELDNDEYKLICMIIDSTNETYINTSINKINEKNNLSLPIYKYDKGLPLGSLTSQFFAIFYLTKLHHFIIHDMHYPRIVVYMDDYLIFGTDKENLKELLKILKIKLNEDYLLNINEKKTEIKNLFNGIGFLGYNFKIVNNKLIIKLSSSNRQKLKKK